MKKQFGFSKVVMRLIGNSGMALATVMIFTVILLILGAAFLKLATDERISSNKNMYLNQAFYLAEAGVNKALVQLKNNYNNKDSIPLTTLAGAGEYSATITSGAGNSRIVMAHGFVPSAASASKVERVIEVEMSQYIPSDFYDNAIYSAEGVDIGNNCVVNGDVFSGGTVDGSVNGNITQNDPTLHDNGLPLLSFDQLQQKSEDQGWYDPVTGETTFPDTFWNVEPTPPDDPGTPNVVFVNGDFTLVGGKQVVQGFIVVGGNTVYNAEIGGNASIIGCLYTRGDIWFHGGGGKVINVDGGVWAGGTVTMDGNEQINFDPPGHGTEYMATIENLVITEDLADVQVTSWREM